MNNEEKITIHESSSFSIAKTEEGYVYKIDLNHGTGGLCLGFHPECTTFKTREETIKHCIDFCLDYFDKKLKWYHCFDSNESSRNMYGSSVKSCICHLKKLAKMKEEFAKPKQIEIDFDMV